MRKISMPKCHGMLYAPVYFRLLFQSGPLDAKATDAIMQTALEGLAATSPKVGVAVVGRQ